MEVALKAVLDKGLIVRAGGETPVERAAFVCELVSDFSEVYPMFLEKHINYLEQLGREGRVLDRLAFLTSDDKDYSKQEREQFAERWIKKYIQYVREERTSPGLHSLEDWVFRNRRTTIWRTVYESPDEESIDAFERICTCCHNEDDCGYKFYKYESERKVALRAENRSHFARMARLGEARDRAASAMLYTIVGEFAEADRCIDEIDFPATSTIEESQATFRSLWGDLGDKTSVECVREVLETLLVGSPSERWLNACSRRGRDGKRWPDPDWDRRAGDVEVEQVATHLPVGRVLEDAGTGRTSFCDAVVRPDGVALDGAYGALGDFEWAACWAKAYGVVDTLRMKCESEQEEEISHPEGETLGAPYYLEYANLHGAAVRASCEDDTKARLCFLLGDKYDFAYAIEKVAEGERSGWRWCAAAAIVIRVVWGPENDTHKSPAFWEKAVAECNDEWLPLALVLVGADELESATKLAGARGEVESLATAVSERAEALVDEGYDELSSYYREYAARLYEEIVAESGESVPEEQAENSEERRCACGEVLQPHWKLCPGCGEQLDLICSCGEPLKDSWRLCPVCGKSIGL